MNLGSSYRYLYLGAFAVLLGCGGGPTVVNQLPWFVASEQASDSVAIVSVLDFECEHSRAQFEVLQGLAAGDGDRIRWSRRYFPRNDASMPAVRAIMCAREQGRESVFAPILFRSRIEQAAALTSSDVLTLAESTDLALAAFRQCIETEVSTTLIQQEVGVLQDANVTALPTTFVGRERHDGFVPLEDLRASIERERGRGYQR